MSEYTDTLDLRKLKEPAYVWIGKEMPALLLAAGEGRHEDLTSMLVALDRAHDVPVAFRPVIEFFKYPREESEVKDWIRNTGDDDGTFLPWLVEEKAVVRIAPGDDPLTSLGALHLENNGMMMPAEGQEESLDPEPGLVMFSNNTSQPDIELTPVLRNLLFEHHDDDLRAAIQGAAQTLNVTPQAVSDELSSRLPVLMRDDFAFLLYME